MLETADAMAAVEQMGLIPVEIFKQVERKHIFTHIEWKMRGIYLEVKEPVGDFVWLTGPQIESQAALPTAFRQFWEGKDHV
jgi:A/G-specific adenine glycosylase